MSRPPARCIACQVNRVAWVKPRVDYCYECLPGGPFKAPPCRRCGSSAYFSSGLCERCHPGAPLHPGSCRGCLAWGVYRAYNWRCWSCRWWQGHYPLGECLYCRRRTTVGELGACRLCLEQARFMRQPGRALDFAGANRFGQQLFLANMRFQRPRTSRLRAKSRRERRDASAHRLLDFRQERLFELAPDPERLAQRVLADAGLLAYSQEIVREHAARHGWSARQRNDVMRSLRLLTALQHTPGEKIRATDVLQLPRYDGNINSTLEVLASAGLLIDDRISPVERYFAGKTDALPAPMREQLEIWLEVMLKGSRTAPRQRSRDPETLRIQIMGIAPIVHGWAAQGHRSLAEITPEQVRIALPASGAKRNWAEHGLRSLFRALKARKLVFSDPTRRLPATPREQHCAAAPGHCRDLRGASLARPRDRVGRRPGRLPRPYKQAAARASAHRHRRRAPHTRRSGHSARRPGARAPARLARSPRPHVATDDQPAPVRRHAAARPDSHRPAANSPGAEPASPHRPCAKTA